MPVIFLDPITAPATEPDKTDPKKPGTLADYNGGTIAITELPKTEEQEHNEI